jgi:hypothetical protein
VGRHASSICNKMLQKNERDARAARASNAGRGLPDAIVEPEVVSVRTRQFRDQ